MMVVCLVVCFVDFLCLVVAFMYFCLRFGFVFGSCWLTWLCLFVYGGVYIGWCL